MWMSSKHYQMLLLGTYSAFPSLLGVLQHLTSLVAQFPISFFASTKQDTVRGAMM